MTLADLAFGPGDDLRSCEAQMPAEDRNAGLATIRPEEKFHDFEHAPLQSSSGSWTPGRRSMLPSDMPASQ